MIFPKNEYSKFFNEAMIKKSIRTPDEGSAEILPGRGMLIEETEYGRIVLCFSKIKFINFTFLKYIKFKGKIILKNFIYYYTFLSITFLDIAYAYIGPGMSGGLIATILGVIGSIFLVIFGILYYPIKRFFKNRRKK
jgi:hypothetical protein